MFNEKGMNRGASVLISYHQQITEKGAQLGSRDGKEGGGEGGKRGKGRLRK